MTVDWPEVRREFPVFQTRNYLASACLGPFPTAGFKALQEYAESRALHNRSVDLWLSRLHEVCALCAQLLGVSPQCIALRESATAGQAAVVGSLHATPKRNRIVVSALDFHSSLHLYAGQATRGFEVVRVPSQASPWTTDVEAMVDAVDERTALVAVSLVSRYGALVNVAPIVEQARRVGAVSLVDAYQAVGIVPVHAEQCAADVMVAGTLKWLSGSTGCAFVYASDAFSSAHVPAFPGWFAHANLDRFVRHKGFEDDFVPMSGAGRFQQGTPAMAPMYEAIAGLRLIQQIGVTAMQQRNQVLLDRLWCSLSEHGYHVMTPRGAAVGALCVRMREPEPVVQALAEAGIDIDQRRNEVLRIAPHPCSTEDECDALVVALRGIRAPKAS